MNKAKLTLAFTTMIILTAWLRGEQSARDAAQSATGAAIQSARAPSDADSGRSIETSSALLPSPVIAFDSNRVAPNRSAETRVMSKVPMSYEHSKMTEHAVGKKFDLHAMLESEAKDTAWAYDAEQRLRQMFEYAGAQVYSLECRSTLCEVQAFTDLEDRGQRLEEAERKLDFREFTYMGFSSSFANRQAHLRYYLRPATPATGQPQ